MLSGYEPMLATARHLDQVPPGWAAEPKLDGWRAIVTIEDDGVTVRSRRGNDLTPMVPELGRLSSMVPSSSFQDFTNDLAPSS